MPSKPCKFWSQESLFLLLSNTDSPVWILAQEISQKGVAIVPEEGERADKWGEQPPLKFSVPSTPNSHYSRQGEPQCSAHRYCHSITRPTPPLSSRTQKFVEPLMEGSCYWPLPLRRVENGPSSFQLNLFPHAIVSQAARKPKKESWRVSHLELLLSNFSNCPLASLGNRQQFILCCKIN